MFGFTVNRFSPPQRGSTSLDASFFANLVTEVSNAMRLTFSNRFSVKEFGNCGKYIDLAVSDAAAAVTAYVKPFDLVNEETVIDESTTHVASIMDYQGRSHGTSIAGIQQTVAAGTGFTWHGSDATPALKWSMAAITASTYIYLTIERATPGATLNKGSSIPDGDDDTEYHSLWYVPWVTATEEVPAHIDWASVVDMRGMIRLPAMA